MHSQQRGVAPSIRYSLASQSADDGRIEIILDLYRGSVPALTRRIATVERMHARAVLSKCQRHLEMLGAHAVANFSFGVPPTPPVPAPAPRRQRAASSPVAAFDWIFAG